MPEERKFVRLTGMNKMRDIPKCWTQTPGREPYLRQLLEAIEEALNTPGMSVQFSFWDNGDKPGTLNYRVQPEQSIKPQGRPYPQRGGTARTPNRAYVPRQRPQTIPVEEPQFDEQWEDPHTPVSEAF